MEDQPHVTSHQMAVEGGWGGNREVRSPPPALGLLPSYGLLLNLDPAASDVFPGNIWHVMNWFQHQDVSAKRAASVASHASITSDIIRTRWQCPCHWRRRFHPAGGSGDAPLSFDKTTRTTKFIHIYQQRANVSIRTTTDFNLGGSHYGARDQLQQETQPWHFS